MSARFAVMPLAVLAVISPFFVAAQQPDSRLQNTLKRLDTTSATFTSAQATFHKELYNALVKDTTSQDGSVYSTRSKAGTTQMGVRIDGPGARIVELKNGVIRDYNPALKCFDTVQASGKLDSFLTLGFGGSGKDLARTWAVTDAGPETISGMKVEKLILVPKEITIKNNIVRVALWMDLDRGVSIKQLFEFPSHDTQTAVYSGIRLNKPVSAKPFEFRGNACGR